MARQLVENWACRQEMNDKQGMRPCLSHSPPYPTPHHPTPLCCIACKYILMGECFQREGESEEKKKKKNPHTRQWTHSSWVPDWSYLSKSALLCSTSLQARLPGRHLPLSKCLTCLSLFHFALTLGALKLDDAGQGTQWRALVNIPN